MTPKTTELDWLVVTAANRTQARAYTAQLRARHRRGDLAGVHRWLVISDAGDRRIGSGASTLLVLLELARRLAAGHLGHRDARHAPASIASLFAGQRVLVLHSGGDSRRLPAYAAQGKIFTPLPRQTTGHRPADLFDLILEDLSAIVPAAGRVVIAAGDLLLNLAHRPVNLAGPGVVGVARPSGVDRGSRHGVYVLNESGEVADFLQKPTASLAAARNAISPSGRVLVDTGVVSLDAATVERWLVALGAKLKSGASGLRVTLSPGLLEEIRRGRAPLIDLYEHVLMSLPQRRTSRDFLREISPAADPRDRALLARFFSALHGPRFTAAVARGGDFLHIGSSRELLDVVSLDHRLRGAPPAADGLTIYNSDASAARRPALSPALGRAIIEGSDVPPGLRLVGDNIVVGLPSLNSPHRRPGAPRGRPSSARRSRLLRLERGWGLVCLPIGRRDWAAVVFHVSDDFKTPIDRGGAFGSRTWAHGLARASVSPDDLWPAPHKAVREPHRRAGATVAREHGVELSRTWWDARLWARGPIGDVLRHARWLMRPSSPVPADWLAARRCSLAQLADKVNHHRLLAQRAELQRRERLTQAVDRLSADPWLPAQSVADDVRSAAEAAAVLNAIDAATTSRRSAQDVESDLRRARLCRAAAVLNEQKPARRVARMEEWNQRAFRAVADAVARDSAERWRSRRARLKPGEVVWGSIPARLDFAGGWSDTPPISYELGGAVLNAAITLDGQQPLQATARLIEDPVIRLHSLDLRRSLTLTNTQEALQRAEAGDWSAIARTALRLCGVTPASPRDSLRRHLRAWGGGLELTFYSALPKGSGLGTSSLLGALLIAVLDRLTGRDTDPAVLIRRTTLLEQRMTTAGGWQDQAGGIFPGIKRLTTSPGSRQDPTVDRLAPDLWGLTGPGGPLAERVLLYNTGDRRLARDILQNVVKRYLAREPEALRVILRLKQGADEARRAVQARDAEAFAAAVAEYWTLKKQLDPGSTTPRIEALLKPIAAQLSAFTLAGAGGGGFLFMIARDGEAARRVRAYLQRRPASPRARVQNFEFDRTGLRLGTL